MSDLRERAMQIPTDQREGRERPGDLFAYSG